MRETCPNCQAELVPSVVGHLCVECGTVHRFYKTEPVDELEGQPSISKYEPVESAAPVIEPEVPSATKLDPEHELLPPDDPQLEKLPHTQNKQPAEQPEVTLSEARSYRKKLRHRLKSLVVPELPQPHRNQEKQPDTFDALPPLPPRPADQLPPISDKLKPDDYGVGMPIEPNVPVVNDIKPSKSSSHRLRNTILALLVFALIAGVGGYLYLKRSNRMIAPAASTTPLVTPSVTPAPTTTPSPEAAKRDDQRKKDLKDIATALEVYRRANGSYPAGNDISALYPLQYTNPPYISYINYDPASTASNKIKYGYNSDGTNFTLTAQLEVKSDPDAKDGVLTVTNTKN